MRTPGPNDEARCGASPVQTKAPASGLSSVARKEQQLVFLLTRQLVEAQIVRGDRARSQRLWQEVAALELDPERITALLYGVGDHDDPLEMEAVDRRQLSQATSDHPPVWFSWRRRGWAPGARRHGAGLRGAPPAAPRAHRQAR
jgi:hypothetical protein